MGRSSSSSEENIKLHVRVNPDTMKPMVAVVIEADNIQQCYTQLRDLFTRLVKEQFPNDQQ
jgi:hypothetical protein